MKKTFRNTLYAVVSETSGEVRLILSKDDALDLAKQWRKLGLGVTLWKGKPTWRQIG